MTALILIVWTVICVAGAWLLFDALAPVAG